MATVQDTDNWMIVETVTKMDDVHGEGEQQQEEQQKLRRKRDGIEDKSKEEGKRRGRNRKKIH